MSGISISGGGIGRGEIPLETSDRREIYKRAYQYTYVGSHPVSEALENCDAEEISHLPAVNDQNLLKVATRSRHEARALTMASLQLSKFAEVESPSEAGAVPAQQPTTGTSMALQTRVHDTILWAVRAPFARDRSRPPSGRVSSARRRAAAQAERRRRPGPRCTRRGLDPEMETLVTPGTRATIRFVE